LIAASEKKEYNSLTASIDFGGRTEDMAKIVVKETVTKEREIDISLDAFISLIDDLAVEDKKRLLEVVSSSIGRSEALKFVPFKKDTVERIVADFEETGFYDGGFLADLERGLRKSSTYK
jgi:hypothetical protein